MGRVQRALTSLVAAIPAGFLAYLLVMVFLNSADSLPMMLKIIVGLTLLCAAFVTLMPFILLIPGKKAPAEPAKASGGGKGAKVAVADDDEEVEEAGLDDADEDAVDSAEIDIDESDAEIMSDSDDAIASGSESSLDEIEAFDMDDDDEPAPPPKKRKK